MMYGGGEGKKATTYRLLVHIMWEKLDGEESQETALSRNFDIVA